MKTMIRLLFYILLCSMPVFSFAQGKITRPNNGIAQGSTPKKETVQEPTIGSVNGHDWVDLGLPSGTRWATCNVGAPAIQDCGYYLSWGGLYIPKDEIYSRENAPLFGKTLEIFLAITRMMQPDPSGEDNGVCQQKPIF